jgi:hypothetical protein
MWLAPALLLVIGILLIRAGFEQRQTLESGLLVTAKVRGVEIRNRADVTYGHIDLAVPDPKSGDSSDVRLPLPLSLLMGVQGERELDVRLMDQSDQPVVIETIARAQWRMSFIHASMCLVGALLLAWPVGAWNRYLRRRGDPSDLPPED